MTTTDSHRALRILGDLDRFLVAVLDPILKDIGIGREHWQLLRLLEDGQGRSMGDIRESLGLPGATATRVVDLLVANTLVYRRSDPLDRRRVLVYLSEPGEEGLRRIEEGLRDHVGALLADVDPDEGRLLASLLGKLAGIMTERGPEMAAQELRRD